MKRILSLLLVAIMVLCSVQISVFAAEPAQLKAVSVEGGVIVPGFLPGVYEYTVGIVPNGALPEINYELADESAIVDIEKASEVGETTIIKVSKGETFKEYKFTYVLKNKDGSTVDLPCSDIAKISTVDNVNDTMFKNLDNGDDFYLQSRSSKFADILVKFNLEGVEYNPYGKFEFSFYTSSKNYGDTEFGYYLTSHSDWNGIFNSKNVEIEEEEGNGEEKKDAFPFVDISYSNSLGNGSMTYNQEYKATLKKGDTDGYKTVDVSDMVRSHLAKGNKVFTIAVHLDVATYTTFRLRTSEKSIPKLTYTRNFYDKDATIKDVEIENGILDKFFSSDVENYKIGVEEGVIPKIKYVKGSPYSTAEYTPATAIGETAKIKVIPQDPSISSKEYRFTIVPKSEIGISENGKLEVNGFTYINSGVEEKELKASTQLTLEGKIRNNNLLDKKAALISTIKDDGVLSYINISSSDIKSGNDKMTDNITTPANVDKALLQGFIFDAESKKLISSKAKLSKVEYKPVIVDTTEKLSYELNEDRIVLYGKGNPSSDYILVVTYPGKTLDDIKAGDMKSVVAVFDLCKTNEKGIWESEINVPISTSYYNAWIIGDETSSSIKFLSASKTAKVDNANSVYNDIYSETGSDAEKIAKLKATLALGDESNITAEILGMDKTFLSEVSEDSVVSTLYYLTKEKFETQPIVDELSDINILGSLYSQSVVLAKLNSSKYVSKIAVISAFGYTDLEPLYNKMIPSEQEKTSASYLGQNIGKASILYDILKKDILLSIIAYPKNPADPQEIIDTYYTDLGLDMTYYSQLSSKELMIAELIDEGPYTSTDSLKTKFYDLSYSYYENQSENSGSSGSSGGGGGSSKPSVSTAPTTGAGDVGNINTDAFVPEVKSNFNDVSVNSWALESVNYLSDKGIISGMGDGRFEPDRSIKREEFAKILCSAFDLKLNGEAKKFDDIDANEWYAEFVNIAASNGIINGMADGVFGQGMELSRQDIAVMLSRVLDVKDVSEEKFADDEEIADYAKEAVYTLRKMGVLNGTGDGKFEPARAVTRAECAKIIYGIIKK